MGQVRSVQVPIEVRFKDLDAMGHVNNAVYFTYFEEARKAFLHQVFDVRNPRNYFFILAGIRCDFVRPITLENRVKTVIYIGKIGNKSFTFKYKIVDLSNNDIIYATGESVQVYFEYEKSRSMPIPQDIREKLNEYLEILGE